MITETIEDILVNTVSDITDSINIFVGFDCKRKYKRKKRKLKKYHKNGLFEDCPIFTPMIPHFMIKTIRNRIKNRNIDVIGDVVNE